MIPSELVENCWTKLAGDLSQSEREALSAKDFAEPKAKAKKLGVAGKIEGTAKGRYPIPDEAHARNALARVSQFGSPAEKEAVRAKVRAKFPEIEQEKKAMTPAELIENHWAKIASAEVEESEYLPGSPAEKVASAYAEALARKEANFASSAGAAVGDALHAGGKWLGNQVGNVGGKLVRQGFAHESDHVLNAGRALRSAGETMATHAKTTGAIAGLGAAGLAGAGLAGGAGLAAGGAGGLAAGTAGGFGAGRLTARR